MGRHAAVVFYVLTLAAVVVGVDVLFFRNRFWARLLVNVGIVLVFAAFYLRFLKRPWAQAVAMRLTHLHLSTGSDASEIESIISYSASPTGSRRLAKASIIIHYLGWQAAKRFGTTCPRLRPSK
jgi:hypothetical protein